MKVIDLLNKIANGEEVPEKIKYNNEKYKYYKDIDYRDERGNYLLSGEPICIAFLNDEVEIIEEEKKILKKISLSSYHNSTDDIKEKVLINKINEIIDYLNSKGDEIDEKRKSTII